MTVQCNIGGDGGMALCTDQYHCLDNSMQSNNMVFNTVARYYQQFCAVDGMCKSLPHIIISNLEHDSVDLTVRKMEELGRIGMCHTLASLSPYCIYFMM